MKQHQPSTSVPPKFRKSVWAKKGTRDAMRELAFKKQGKPADLTK